MLDLCHKSLTAKQWNTGLGSYIYGVHDLLLWHLRKKLTQDQWTQLHKSVIEKYRIYCNDDFSKLPDDNYIYWYIGHHLEAAKLFDEFPRLFFDLDFIQAKIMHTGLSDLLLDLRKYRKYITNDNDEDEAKILNIEIFCFEKSNIIADQRRKNCLDIIQIAMNHSCEGFVAQKARELAITRGRSLYLFHEKLPKADMQGLSEEITTNVCTSSFTSDLNSILIGGTSGSVALWNSETKNQIVFNGHSSKCTIKKIVVSAKGDHFLALSDTGIIKLFHLNLDDAYEQHCAQVHSPKQKQNFWTGMFTNSSNMDDCLMEFQIIDEVILDMAFAYEGKYIGACTNQGTVKVFSIVQISCLLLCMIFARPEK